jgi:predicted Zn-ribbon and HTH transcriptional regulator
MVETVVKQITVKMTKCKHCGYEWISRVKTPKKCPRCGRRLE